MTPAVVAPALAEAARAFVPAIGDAPVRLEPLRGGRNNRLYKLSTPEGDRVLKHYFRHPGERRDRLGSEWAFLTHAWSCGVRCIPRPIAKDDARGIGVYGFCEGRPLAARDVGRSEVTAAIEFLASINPPTARAAASLGPASEACFSIDAHVAMVDARIGRLNHLFVRDDLAAEADRFVRQELAPAWRAIRDHVLRSARHPPCPSTHEVAARDRIISPSDFGFHNALRGDDGRLVFLDFEYGGWDDPAKLVCDFFFQRAVPVPEGCFDEVAQAVAALVGDGVGMLTRVALLRPLLGVKWCCIVLNHFSPVDLARRVFAVPSAPGEKAAQLAKARKLLGELTGRGEG